MSISVTPLHPFNTAHYAPLVASSLTYLLDRVATGGTEFGFGCAENGAPVGVLIAAERGPTDFEILWLYVARAKRRAGAARALLEAFEAHVGARGPCSFRMTYPLEPAAPEGLEAFFVARGWSLDLARFTVCVLQAGSLARAPWLAKWMQEPSPEVFPWSEISPAERTRLEASVDGDPVLAGNLSPFRHESGMNPETSFGMRRDGQVVAWFLTHLAAPGTLQYSLLGATNAVRGTGDAFATVAETVRRHVAIQGEDALGIVAASNDNAVMLRLIQTRFAPHIQWKREVAAMGRRP